MAAGAGKRESIYQLKVSIKDVRPPVWRRLQVPGAITLGALHDVLQTAFGWTDSHLHQFVFGETYYGVRDVDDPVWDPPLKDEAPVPLADALGGANRFAYEYDFGDDWEHRIVVEKVLAREAGVAYPRCLAGRRARPPEDCGGPWGYADLLAAISDPAHPDHEEMREWLGDPFDPEAFDLDMVNVLLRPRPRRRR